MATGEETTPPINSTDLARVVTTPLKVLALVHAIEQDGHPHTRHRGHDYPPLGQGLAQANVGIELPREQVQAWLDNGDLVLQPEPNPTTQKGIPSPQLFLNDHGLTRPPEK